MSEKFAITAQRSQKFLTWSPKTLTTPYLICIKNSLLRRKGCVRRPSICSESYLMSKNDFNRLFISHLIRYYCNTCLTIALLFPVGLPSLWMSKNMNKTKLN